ncbi:hypothetical protein BJ965_003595 [Streptomyces luteogriseus]|uniref:Uncharacterized protein n=1 Tax=Streptomyces luteogriseus TaxID=68233 RepID=A0A7W7DNK6_9ACTN|nr:hypothetical protein [Streptomyces luteogriseus]MBB4713713.1 hypothetical protein [Streptomyces luteogriseus]
METFVTVAVILGLIVVGALLIRLLNSQHGDRMAGVRYGHTGMPVAGPAPSARRRGPRQRGDERHRPPRPTQARPGRTRATPPTRP